MIAGPRFSQAVEQRKGWATLNRVAMQGGMRPMHQVALDWVTQAKTTLVEVERVLGQIVEEEPEDEAKGPPRVLLVDDDAGARLMMRTLMEAEGYLVEEAEDGHRAIDKLKADPNYALCILDLSMPGLDGREVLRLVRGSVDTAALPVMIRTGTGSEKVEAELLEAGADDYLDKSVEPARFLARVKAVMRRSLI
jgi:CheY-like chemotaxis protein